MMSSENRTSHLDELQGFFAVLGRLRPEAQVLPEERQEHLPFERGNQGLRWGKL